MLGSCTFLGIGTGTVSSIYVLISASIFVKALPSGGAPIPSLDLSVSI
jgi:hypothetical protein